MLLLMSVFLFGFAPKNKHIQTKRDVFLQGRDSSVHRVIRDKDTIYWVHKKGIGLNGDSCINIYPLKKKPKGIK
jgi:hypothetical protein